ncbi:cell division protein ZipA [Microbulbifer thermotolerans]|uniref:Cell division protein ZipA n=1 Tax=Microbulbifer thermotolerans TaxID=252514 RepID=A0A143HM34_MICTH|nr:cell division protein ZipA [Microbulbifer thermotolerans]AMX02774.1 hypothetical protein A3224_09410 [Microbulbifer thermotolerans]MCX2779632.1 cell division protein ZipA [Microbulbifer thermotolerans]MCX2794610.1 cell division protein ZipA [Microbulbifer thermotolerans]MCX2801438.1 cell division protein ZipA [Microbulbifer thermotolerans]MCX2804937.1 cell division protein ZipA [Microbulbifer thermotolerans]
MGNWLITILGLIVLLAVLDGVRRAILKHRAAMKVSDNLSRAMRQESDDHDILSAPRRAAPRRADNPAVGESGQPDPEEAEKRRQIAAELPGQVRVVQRRALEDALRVNRKVQESFMSSRKPLAGSNPNREAPEQASLNLEEQVPTLMDSVADDERREPELDESESLEALYTAPEEETPVSKPAVGKAAPPARKEKPAKKHTVDAEVGEEHKREQREKSPVEEVLIINVVAPDGDSFDGKDILRAVMAAGMRFGEMDIFHYHQGGADDGPVVFSLANMVVPGVFDLARMEAFSTPGLSLFLALPIEEEAIKAFEQLLTTSRQIAELLGGELKDENRSVFTAQTAEHYRQRVVEYQRRRALAKAQA